MRASEDSMASRLCRDCGYDLRGLATNRCPECGRSFDPTDLATTAPAGVRRWVRIPWQLDWIAGAPPIAFLVVFYANFFYIELTSPYGAIPPTHPGVGWLVQIETICEFASVVAIPVAGVVSILHLHNAYLDRRNLRRLAISCGPWLVLLASCAFDPFGAWYWWLD